MQAIYPMMLHNKNYSHSSTHSAKSNPFKSHSIKSPKKTEDLHSSNSTKSNKHYQPQTTMTKLSSWTESLKSENPNHWISNPIIMYLSGTMMIGQHKWNKKKQKTKNSPNNNNNKTENQVSLSGNPWKNKINKNPSSTIKKMIDLLID